MGISSGEDAFAIRLETEQLSWRNCTVPASIREIFKSASDQPVDPLQRFLQIAGQPQPVRVGDILAGQQGSRQVQTGEWCAQLMRNISDRIAQVHLLLLQKVSLLSQADRHLLNLALQNRKLALLTSGNQDLILTVQNPVDPSG